MRFMPPQSSGSIAIAGFRIEFPADMTGRTTLKGAEIIAKTVIKTCIVGFCSIFLPPKKPMVSLHTASACQHSLSPPLIG